MIVNESHEIRKRILMELMPSRGRILGADAVELALFVAFVLAVFEQYIQIPWLSQLPPTGQFILMAILYMAIEEIFLLTTGGPLGMFLMRIAYVNGVTGVRFNHDMIWGYSFYLLKNNLSYQFRRDRSSFLSSPTGQRKSMLETDTYFVDIAKYKILVRDGVLPFRSQG